MGSKKKAKVISKPKRSGAKKPVKVAAGKKLPARKKPVPAKKKATTAPEPRAAARVEEIPGASVEELEHEVESIGDGTEATDFPAEEDDDEMPPEVDDEDDEGYF